MKVSREQKGLVIELDWSEAEAFKKALDLVNLFDDKFDALRPLQFELDEIFTTEGT